MQIIIAALDTQYRLYSLKIYENITLRLNITTKL